jgi:hypothetical protein
VSLSPEKVAEVRRRYRTDGEPFVHFSGAWLKTLPAALGKPQIRTALALLELVLMTALLVVLAGHGSKGAAIAFLAASVLLAAAAIASVHVVLRREEAASTA